VLLDGVEAEGRADALALLQSAGQLRNHRAEEGLAAGVADAVFRNAFVLSIRNDSYADARQRMRSQGVTTEWARGFDGSNESELADALQLLKKYGMTETLHPTVNNWLACMHTSPGKPPDFTSALSELAHSAVRSTPRNVDELLAHDSHRCVPKVVAIAAAHVRLWEEIAAGQRPAVSVAPGEDPWFLVMEDDAQLCPGWRKRLADEMPQVPADADVVKLFFFGHWRGEDKVKNPDGSDSPFLQVKDPLKGKDLVTAALYELLKGGSWKTVPIAGFYAGTQAYLIKRAGAQKLLKAIRGAPFQDIDMTMMLSVKHYVFRRVLTSSADNGGAAAGDSDDSDGSSGMSLLQTGTVPTCNHEPSKDWFGH